MRNPSHKAVLPPIKFELTDLPEVIEPETDSEIAELWEDWDRAVAQADAKSPDGLARALARIAEVAV